MKPRFAARLDCRLSFFAAWRDFTVEFGDEDAPGFGVLLDFKSSRVGGLPRLVIRVQVEKSSVIDIENQREFERVKSLGGSVTRAAESCFYRFSGEHADVARRVALMIDGSPIPERQRYGARALIFVPRFASAGFASLFSSRFKSRKGQPSKKGANR